MSNCLGVVLAGGLSSRMGKDKSTLKRNQESMLNFSKQLLSKAQVNNVVVSGNGHEVTDVVANAGPLGGIYSVILKHKPEAILVLPVDLPLMTKEALHKLKQAGELSKKACYYQQHYLPLYLPITAYVELYFQQAFSQFSGKGPSIRALLEKIPHNPLTPNSEQTLFNSNTPDQWQHAKTLFINKRNSYV